MPKSKSKAQASTEADDSLAIFHDGEASQSLLPDPPSDDDGYVYPVTAFPPRSAFEVSNDFPALILPAKRTNQVRNQLKSILLSRPRLSVVVEVSESDLDSPGDQAGKDPPGPSLVLTKENMRGYRKLVLHPQRAGLHPPSKQQQQQDPATPSENHQHEMNHLLRSLLDDEPESFRLGRHTITLSYDHWTAEEILKRLLVPTGIAEVPSSFEAVGHLAHVNLRGEVLPYKLLIGKVLLEKNSPRIQTVCNKVGSIGDSEYRTFGMEVIAGKDHEKDGDGSGSWSDVLVKEEGCEYQLDFRKVYWNSRLGGEHRRLVQLIKRDAAARAQPQHTSTRTSTLVVADLMAGIGPFAIPLTAKNLLRNGKNNGKRQNNKKKQKGNNNGDGGGRLPPMPIEVYANDLNPSSYEFLVANAKRNKCDFESDKNFDSGGGQKHNLHVSNMDGRAYCHRLQDKGIRPDHFLMNLPASALELLDCFRGYPSDSDGSRPRIHVHCFAPKDPQASRSEIWKRAETALGCPLHETDDAVVIHTVRDIAPNKNMYCLSFLIPTAACTLPRIDLQKGQEKPLGDSDPSEQQQEQKRERSESDTDTGAGTEANAKKQKQTD